MKKLIALLLTMILVLTLAACGEKTPAGDAGESKPGQNEGTNLGENQKDESDKKTLTVDEVKAAPETPADVFSYRETEEGIVIYGYEGDGGIVVIPEKIDGVDVVAIDVSAFANQDTITAVRLPDTLVKVSSKAFVNCSGMKLFISGASVKSLGAYAFNGCTKLEYAELNDGLESIGLICFGGAKRAEIVIPASVTEITNPFAGESAEHPVVIVGEPGSAAEKYVTEYGQACFLEFRAK